MSKDKRSSKERTLIVNTVKKVGRCEKCGAHNDLQGHHKVPKSVNPALILEPTNIEVLCANCHAAEHGDIAGFIARPRRKKGKVVSCEGCATKIYKKPSHVFAKNYCSSKCKRAGDLRKCAACGKEFYAKRKFILRGQGLYCSSVCFGFVNGPKSAAIRWADSPRNGTVCQTCGKKFTTEHSRPAKFCSLHCFGVSQAPRLAAQNRARASHPQ